MAPVGHLSNLCQGAAVEPILDFLRQRVRGPDGEEPPRPLPAEDDDRTPYPALRGCEAGPHDDLMAYRDGDGRTALHWAAALRNFDLVALLLRPPYRAPALTWDESRATPLLTAVMVHAPEPLLQLLLDRSVEDFPRVMHWLRAVEPGPQSTLASGASSTAGGPARTHSDEEGDGVTSGTSWNPRYCPLPRLLDLVEVSEEGATEKMRAAIVNTPDQLGNTPLLAAVSRGHTTLVPFLLGCGADPSAQNQQGQTALHRAVSKSHYGLVEMLLQQSEIAHGGPKSKGHRAFVNTPDKRGNTALFYASMENDEEIGSYLLQHGADREVKNKDGKYFYEV